MSPHRPSRSVSRCPSWYLGRPNSQHDPAGRQLCMLSMRASPFLCQHGLAHLRASPCWHRNFAAGGRVHSRAKMQQCAGRASPFNRCRCGGGIHLCNFSFLISRRRIIVCQIVMLGLQRYVHLATTTSRVCVVNILRGLLIALNLHGCLAALYAGVLDRTLPDCRRATRGFASIAACFALRRL